MGNIIKPAKSFLNSNAGAIPFKRSYNVLIGTSRLNRCTCIDNGNPLTGKIDSGRKGSTDGYDCVHKEVGNRATQNETINTGARELGLDEYSEMTTLISSQTVDHMPQNTENESKKTPASSMISNDFFYEVSPEANCSKNPELIDELENSPSIDAQEDKKVRKKRVSHVFDSLSGHNVLEELADDVLSFGCETSSDMELEWQRHVRAHHTLPSDGIVPVKGIAICTTLNARGLESTPKTSLERQAARKKDTIKVHQSPLTRSKAKSLSISTPESLKRSRSGRLLVPRLDPGSQNIIYGPDGIVGITNFELYSSQESNWEPPTRRKRSRCLLPD